MECFLYLIPVYSKEVTRANAKSKKQKFWNWWKLISWPQILAIIISTALFQWSLTPFFIKSSTSPNYLIITKMGFLEPRNLGWTQYLYYDWQGVSNYCSTCISEYINFHLSHLLFEFDESKISIIFITQLVREKYKA